MFDQLFERPHALIRMRTGPLVEERRRYLVHCAGQRMAKATLRTMAQHLLAAAEYLKLAARPDEAITLQEIEEAGTRTIHSDGRFCIPKLLLSVLNQIHEAHIMPPRNLSNNLLDNRFVRPGLRKSAQ